MQAPIAIAIFRGPQYVIELANPAVCEFWGRTRDEVIGKPLFDAIPEARGQGYEQLLANVLHTGETFHANGVHVHFAQHKRHETISFNFVYHPLYESDGSRSGIIVFAQETTEEIAGRKKIEQLAVQLQQHTDAFDAMLTAIKDFVYSFDLEGRFTYSNQPLLDLLDLPLAEIRGKTFHDLPYPKDLATTLQTQITHVIATGKQIAGETPFTSPSGMFGYYEYIFVPIVGKDGKVSGVAGSTRNITERKQQEQQKDEFIAVVSHELKTPVTSLKAFAQILQKRLEKEGNRKAAQYLVKMDKQINKLTALINDLLDVTKFEGGQLQFQEDFFSFDELVQDVIEQVQFTTEKHIIEKIGKTQETLYGDRNRIGQVLINLLTNAIKYSPDAGTIHISMSSNHERINLSVQDFGIGIAKDKQPHIFERFYRDSGVEQQTFPGLGLGLYIAAEILSRQGGTISVESEKGKGSTFFVTLPVQKRNRHQQSAPLPEEERNEE